MDSWMHQDEVELLLASMRTPKQCCCARAPSTAVPHLRPDAQLTNKADSRLCLNSHSATCVMQWAESSVVMCLLQNHVVGDTVGDTQPRASECA